MSKDEVLEMIKHYKNKVNKKINKKIKVIRSDKGGEYDTHLVNSIPKIIVLKPDLVVDPVQWSGHESDELTRVNKKKEYFLWNFQFFINGQSAIYFSRQFFYQTWNLEHKYTLSCICLPPIPILKISYITPTPLH